MSGAREQLLSALAQFAAQPLSVPDLGGGLYVRPLTVGGMARIHAAQQRTPERVPSLMIIDALVDEKGVRVFGDDDEAKIADMPMRIAEQVIAAIDNVSALRPRSAEAATGN